MGDAEGPRARHVHLLLPRAPVHAGCVPREAQESDGLTRLISWNVARRTSVLSEQAAALAEREPDVVALQEVTATTLPRWRKAFGRMGLPNVRSSLEEAPADRQPAAPRRHGVLLAARAALEPVETGVQVPWPETVLSAAVDGVEFTTAHVPNSRNGWIKVETLEGLLAGLRDRSGVLCGDFNTPRSERTDGTVVTFARDRYGRLRPERGERWEAAELGILTGFWPDAFRALHPYEQNDPKEISWNWPRFPRGGYRLDHLFTTRTVERCEYVHPVRTARLSDHSALEADLS